MHAGPFEELSVLIKRLYVMTSRRLSTRMPETMENMISAVDIVQKPGSEVHGGVVGASVPRKRMRGGW